MRPSLEISVSVMLALAFMGCDGSPELTALGSVTLVSGSLTTGFNFATPTRLDGSDATTGTCTITRTVSEGVTRYSLVADLYEPPSDQGDIRSFSLTGQSDNTMGALSAEYSFSADEYATEFRSETCPVTLNYLPDTGEARVVTSDCSLWLRSYGGTGSFTADVDITFAGCVVR